MKNLIKNENVPAPHIIAFHAGTNSLSQTNLICKEYRELVCAASIKSPKAHTDILE